MEPHADIVAAIKALAKHLILHQMEVNAFRSSQRQDLDLGQYYANYSLQKERFQPVLDAIERGSISDLPQELDRTTAKT